MTSWLQQIPRPVIMFAGMALVLLAVLSWLSWLVISQDRAVEQQRLLQRCEFAADDATARLTRQMAAFRQILADAAAGRGVQISDPGIALLVFKDGILTALSGEKLPYYPTLRAAPEPPQDRFFAAEVIESRNRQPLKAAALFAQFAAHREPGVRAAALVRLARAYREAKLPSNALDTYRLLAGMGSITVDGDPAELLAHYGSAVIHAENKDAAGLRNEASAIAMGLADGRWILRRASFEFYDGQCREWLGKSDYAEPTTQALALAEAAEGVYLQWKRATLSADSALQRNTFWVQERSILVAWNSEAEQFSLLCAGPSFLDSVLSSAPGQSAESPAILLEDADGHRVLGNTDPASPVRAVRTASPSALPWTIYAVPSDSRATPGRLSGQARIMLAALSLLILFALVAGFFMARSIAREIAVARLQSDFVAAVSHEFRTPLTTIMQLSEMLVRGRFTGDERRMQFYQSLLGESRRLHGLVESILNFGKLESGKYRYEFQTTDLGELARGVVEDFSKSVAESGCNIDFRAKNCATPVRADREALGRALWNLLDNAVKYSPDHKTVWVEVDAGADGATLSVRDRGLGISPQEQHTIFAKFVRGAAAAERNIKGTGIGLAMVRTILEAHGGTIEVESVPGMGSTFCMRLPRAED